MKKGSSFSAFFIFDCVAIVLAIAVFAIGQPQASQSQKDAQKTSSAPFDAASSAQPADVSGTWQVSWQGRLGSEPCTLHLQQDGTKLSGTFQNLHGLSLLSGKVDQKKVTFDVKFEGSHPFSTRFAGSVSDGKIEGTSQAIGVGGSGAYLGHAGEIVQPEHPWTATRAANEPVHAGENGMAVNPHARK